VYDLVSKEAKPHAILHDASETYMMDLVAPLKYLPEFDHYRAAEERLMGFIYAHFGLSMLEPEEVGIIDKQLRDNEMRDLKGIEPKNNGRAPINLTIRSWTPGKAEREFLKRMKKEGFV
jgi:hypothetical protein